MEYVKLYVSLRDDPKIIGLSDKAFRAYVNALCWCGFHETDGLLAVGAIPPKLLTELRSAGLVDGSLIHNWPKFQKSHQELELTRSERREAGRRGGLARARTDAEQTRSKNVAEVEVRSRELEATTAPNGAPLNGKGKLAAALLAADSTAQYLLSRMSEEWQTSITSAALMKLGGKYGAAAVTDALRNMREEDAGPDKPYAYLEKVCKRHAGAA